MKTAVLSPDGPDRITHVPKVIIDELGAKPSSTLLSEVAEGYYRWRKHGYFGYSTKLMEWNHSSQERRNFSRFIKSSRYIKQTRTHLAGDHCREFEFDDHQLGARFTPSVDGRAPTYSRAREGGTTSCVHTSKTWLCCRERRWAAYCLDKGYQIPVDHFGWTRIAKRVFDTLEALTLPDDSILDTIPDEPRDGKATTEREVAAAFLERANSGELMRNLKYRKGRFYHAISNCPKMIRRTCTIDGEAIAEADLCACFWTLLASMLKPSAERDKLIGNLGGFYEWVNESTDRVFLDEDKQHALDQMDWPQRRRVLGQEVQRQLLFWQASDRRQRPLWTMLARELPETAKLIMRLRRRHGGEKGFANYLMTMEGKVMTPALIQLVEDGKLFLPLHDGIVTRESDAELARQRIRESGEKVLGFKPLVRIK